jgi:hypothetical protein
MFLLHWVPKLSLCLSYHFITPLAHTDFSPPSLTDQLALHFTQLNSTNSLFTSLNSTLLICQPPHPTPLHSLIVLLITCRHGLHRKCSSCCCIHCYVHKHWCGEHETPLPSKSTGCCLAWMFYCCLFCGRCLAIGLYATIPMFTAESQDRQTDRCSQVHLEP